MNETKICVDCRNGDCDSCYEHDCPCNLSGHRKPKSNKRPARRREAGARRKGNGN